MNCLIKTKLSILCLFIIPFSSQAQHFADTLINNAFQTLDAAIVSSKDTRLLSNQAVSVSVFKDSMLNKMQVLGTKDLNSYVPNLYMPDYGSKLNSPIFIRGIGSLRNAPSIGLYVDGIPYMEKNTYDVDLSDIALLEVLRGPQGTLYGRNTMGGIINIHTKSAFTWQGTKIKQTVDHFGNSNSRISNYTKLSSKFALSSSLVYKNKQGYFKHEDTGKKVDQLNDISGKFKFSMQASAYSLFELSSNLQFSKQNGYAYGRVPTGSNLPNLPNYNQDSQYQQWLNSSGLRYRFANHRWIFSASTSFQWFDDAQEIDQDFTADSVFFAIQKQKQHLYSQEFTFRSNHKSNYQWVFGTFAFAQKMDNSVRVHDWKKKAESFKPYLANTHGLAVYHQSDLMEVFIPELSLGIGLRLDYEQSTMNHQSFKVESNHQTLIGSFDSKLNFLEFVPKFNLQYRINAAHQFYSSIAKGYKTGGFNTTFDVDEDRTYDPENSINYELGYKFSMPQITGSASLFYIDWDNQQINRTPASGRGQVIKNAGQTRSLGFELSVNWAIKPHLNMDIQYGYTKATFIKNEPNKQNNFSGNYLPHVPANTISVGIYYDWMINKQINSIRLSTHYSGTGSIYWNEANTFEQSYYQLLNSQIEAKFKTFSCSIWAKNMLNEQYNVYLFNTAAWGAFAQRGTPLCLGISWVLDI